MWAKQDKNLRWEYFSRVAYGNEITLMGSVQVFSIRRIYNMNKNISIC